MLEGGSLTRLLGVRVPVVLAPMGGGPGTPKIVLAEREPIFSFTFGIPEGAVLVELRERGVVTIGTTTSVAAGLGSRWRPDGDGVPAVPRGRDVGSARSVHGMCRSIQQLRGADPPATDAEVTEAARQYVRKLSGYRVPSQANAEVFERAVAEVAESTRRLLDNLVTGPGAAPVVPVQRRLAERRS